MDFNEEELKSSGRFMENFKPVEEQFDESLKNSAFGLVEYDDIRISGVQLKKKQPQSDPTNTSSQQQKKRKQSTQMVKIQVDSQHSFEQIQFSDDEQSPLKVDKLRSFSGAVQNKEILKTFEGRDNDLQVSRLNMDLDDEREPQTEEKKEIEVIEEKDAHEEKEEMKASKEKEEKQEKEIHQNKQNVESEEKQGEQEQKEKAREPEIKEEKEIEAKENE